MGVALGALGWSVAEFWTATPHELAAAVEGLRRFQGGADDAESKAEFMMLYEQVKASDEGR